MLHSDALLDDRSISNNIQSIDISTILKIQRELDPNDIISLVFILYDAPDTALQRLIVYQRVNRDINNDNLNLLHDWAKYAKSKPKWRYEFLEALAVCQLYGVIRKLGFNVLSVKRHFLPDNILSCSCINPVKKVLYKLCENIDHENFTKLKKTLNSYNVNSEEFESCELLFLELMSLRIININVCNNNKRVLDTESVEELAKILEKFPALKEFANYLREVENRSNTKPGSSTPLDLDTSAINPVVDKINETEATKQINNYDDTFKLLADLLIDDDTYLDNIASDGLTGEKFKDVYPIKNPERIGVCYIINQENFHPSKQSINDFEQQEPLEDRTGSSKDKEILQETMKILNFKVITKDNLECDKLIQSIKDVLKNEVNPNDSIFMLCILSHGVKGHIFAADSIKVKIDDIQNLLDSTPSAVLNIPKVLIIQACQVSTKSTIRLLHDSPSTNFYLKKSEFIIFWATAPEYKAYRYGDHGSIFIQLLCRGIKKNYKHEHLNDIFTKVNCMVKYISSKLKINQMPIFNSTLTKKIYFTTSI